MEITRLLHEDHQRVQQLFHKYGTDRGHQKKAIFEEIKNELAVHSQVEEEIFYPALRQARSSKAEDLVTEAMNEHQGIDDIIEELDGMSPQDGAFDVKVKELEQLVVHHVEEEESEVFEQVRLVFSTEALKDLGAQATRRKRELEREDDLDDLR